MLIATALTVLFALLLFTAVRRLFARSWLATLAGLVGLWVGAFAGEYAAVMSQMLWLRYFSPLVFGGALFGVVSAARGDQRS
jgi:hypothetical protein